MTTAFYSQFGQDAFLDKELFKEEEGLFFVEIGSAEPVDLNNTYFLEQQRGWNGLLIEARPSACDKLREHRKSEVINACISDKSGRSIFLDYGYLAGMCKFMSAKEHEYIEQYNSNDTDVRAFWVATKPLSEVLNAREVTNVNLLGIDVEGAELAVLQTIDFNSVFVDVVMAECNTPDAALALDQFLTRENFLYKKTLGADRVYINKNSRFIANL